MAATSKAKARATLELHDEVPIGRIFLALSNPRHEPLKDENEAINWLCEHEDVYPLARDIVRYGLNPLERLALTSIGARRSAETYQVEEGNRRLCALKLLADPDRAPAAYRKNFEKLANGWTPITQVPAVVISDEEVLRIWLERTHSGAQDGVGRRTWDPEQKQRFAKTSKNALAQAVLDYAQTAGMLTQAERAGKLTTAQRFLNNAAVQAAIGIDRTNMEELGRTRSKEGFDKVLKVFIRDLVDGRKVTSRMNSPQIIPYSTTLAAEAEVSEARVPRQPLIGGPASEPKPKPTPAPRPPSASKRITHDNDVADALKTLGNYKLETLYHSICAIDLEPHTPLISVGVWSFLETLTALMGRTENTDFVGYLSKNKLSALGLTANKAFSPALQRVQQIGNETKHHAESANFNGKQLDNDVKLLKAVIIACIKEAKER